MRRFAHTLRSALLLAVAAVGLIAAHAALTAAAPATLQATIEDVARRWPQIGHIKTAQLAALIAAGKVVLFDVRSPAEYAVSRLPGAISVAPDMPTADFLDRYGGAVSGKTAVFYCSVGVRSSKLAERVAAGLKARGAVGVDDLAGGIFAWHGERRALVDGNGPTDFVHPYDSTWGRLLARPQLARTKPGG
jgi:rhodanese-related sulfurtransferase